MSRRLFVALDLPAAVRVAIDRRLEALRASLPPTRWVPRKNFHLTLAFLGATDEARVPELGAALDRATEGVAPFRLAAVGGGTFPPGRPARVAWVGFHGEPGLFALARRVGEAVRKVLDLAPEERPFTPHATVGRPRSPWGRRASERFAEALAGEVESPFPVTETVLYASELAAGGSVYTPVSTHRLGERRACRLEMRRAP